MNSAFPFFIFFLLPVFCFGGVERFLKPIQVHQNIHQTNKQRNALIRHSFSHRELGVSHQESTSRFVDSFAVQKMLSDAIKYRFQVSGDVVAQLSTKWQKVEATSEVILKIIDVSPDELASSSFVRFSLWESGKEMGVYSFPIRVSQFKDVYFTARSISRGSQPKSSDFKLQRVDVLKHHANSVPSSTNLSSYELDTNLLSNTPLKWNNLTKANLIRKGQVIDVYASGKGIYVTMKGLALEDGHLDSLVKVRNLSSDKEFHAKVLSENSVKVSL